MKPPFLLLLALFVCFSFYSCQKDNTTTGSSGDVFIEVNNDSRKPSLVDKTGYTIDLSSFGFPEIYNEPGGIQFVMDIWDVNRSYIGGLGGITSCVEAELYVDVFRKDFASKVSIKTVSKTATKSEKQSCCSVILRLKNKNDDVILAGTAQPNQQITVEFKNGEYYVELSKLKFDGGSTPFTGSARIITN